MSARVQGFLFTLEAATQFSAKPKAKNVLTSFDFVGDLISLRRLDGEKVVDFKQRMMDVSVHPGGPNYLGVINNLTRDFGFVRHLALTIDLKLDSSGEPIARNPRVDILANRVVLYSDWRPSGVAVVDKEIRIYQPTDEGYLLSGLANEINSSTCFSATIDSSARSNYHSTNLVRDTSDLFIQLDPISAGDRTILSGQNIVEDSILFGETNIFKTLVEGTPAAPGEWSIDRVEGIVEYYSSPSGSLGCSYHAGIFPLEIDYSPIKIYTLNDDDFQFEMYNHETLDSGEVVNALPNTEGSEILHQLYKETEVFWGK